MGCHVLLGGDLPDPGIRRVSLASPALAGGSFTASTAWETHQLYKLLLIKNIMLPSSNTHGISRKKFKTFVSRLLTEIACSFYCLWPN